jgi:hypothetical protein
MFSLCRAQQFDGDMSGIMLLYLPTYSPDLNPIEESFSTCVHISMCYYVTIVISTYTTNCSQGHFQRKSLDRPNMMQRVQKNVHQYCMCSTVQESISTQNQQSCNPTTDCGPDGQCAQWRRSMRLFEGKRHVITNDRVCRCCDVCTQVATGKAYICHNGTILQAAEDPPHCSIA